MAHRLRCETATSERNRANIRLDCFISAISTIDQLLICCLRFRPHQLPELLLLFFQNRVAKMTFGKGISISTISLIRPGLRDSTTTR